jgi:L-asparaginase
VAGNNHDDFHYRGSRDKYESRGFLLGGYQHLAPLQARLLLALRLSAGGGAAAAAGGGPAAS